MRRPSSMKRSRPSGPPSRSSDGAVPADVRPRAVAGPVWSAGGAPCGAAVQRRGLAGGVSVIACLWLFVVALVNHDTTVAVMLAALAGSLVGFLRYNLHPATIYLGDAGSLFVGLMLGALAMVSKYTAVNPVAVLAPVLILGVPVFDTLFVMYVRWLRSLPMFLGSLDHFALRLRQLQLSVPQVVVASYVASVVLGGAALAMMFVATMTALVIAGVAMLLAVVAAVWLKRIGMSRPAKGAVLPPAPEPARRAP